MKALIAMAITLSSALLLAGCSDPAERGMKQAMDSRLLDPASAQYKDVAGYSSGYVCGSVNAKNRMGGCIGSKQFLYNDATGVLIIDSAPREFDIRCRNESKKEFYGGESLERGSPLRIIYASLKRTGLN